MRKFGRQRGQRKAFFKTLAYNLIMRGKMVTTDARAKEIRPLVEKLVTLAKKQNLASYRLLLARLPKEAASKLYYEVAPKYADRKGGFLRILKMMKQRKNDGAKQSVVEFI